MRDDAELCRHGLGGNERLLLLEFPYAGWPLDLQDGRLGRRPAACAHALLDAELARWLTRDVPQALLAGAPIPPRPDRRRSIRLPWRR